MVIAAGEDENGLAGATERLPSPLFYLFNSLRFRCALSSSNSFCSRFLLDYVYWKEITHDAYNLNLDVNRCNLVGPAWFDVPICFLDGKMSLLGRENSL
ncbi:unnamed protein product [Musa textilis]